MTSSSVVWWSASTALVSSSRPCKGEYQSRNLWALLALVGVGWHLPSACPCQRLGPRLGLAALCPRLLAPGPERPFSLLAPGLHPSAGCADTVCNSGRAGGSDRPHWRVFNSGLMRDGVAELRHHFWPTSYLASRFCTLEHTNEGGVVSPQFKHHLAKVRAKMFNSLDHRQ